MPTYLSPGVYVEEVAGGSRPIEGVGTAVAAFVGFAPTGPLNTPVLIQNWSQYVAHFGEFTEGSYLAHSVYAYLNNGGTLAYVVRVGGAENDEDVTGSGKARPAASANPEPATLGSFQISALPNGGGGQLTVEVSDTGGDGPDDRFTLTVKDGDTTVESFEVSARKNARNYVVNQVRQNSKVVAIEEATPGGAVSRPANGSVTLNVPPAPSRAPATNGPSQLDASHFLGDTADRTGFGGLEAIDAITMVSVPDAMAAYQRGLLDVDGLKAVQLGVIAHCEQMGDRMAILDAPPGLNAQAVHEWRQNTAGYDSKYAALYYPWVKVFDPSSGRPKVVPPSGHMAGVWARNDTERGVHKAPANEVVRGAIDLELQITKAEQALLNPIGINCVRAFPGRGVRVWGARTLSSDPAWRYLNVRRYFNYLEESILLGTHWVVFEPNDQALWARIRRNVGAFLVNEWRSGSLFGARPEDAFYVKCDAETNPIESVDLGRVVCEIGIAPVKPAEFVVFRLAQFTAGGGELTE
jgi:phage tail sheath protein FI